MYASERQPWIIQRIALDDADACVGDASLYTFLGTGGAGWRTSAEFPLDRPLVGRDDRLLAGRGRGRVSSLPERIGKMQ